MKSSELQKLLAFSFANHFPVLIKGKPGIGKSDIVAQAAIDAGAELIISHPVVSDPTDYKGLPFVVNGQAEFLPFGELNKLINADKLTVFFLDDLGQASTSVQAACMQLLLARRINGHKVSDFVTFVAATNRREDKAGVGGLLEPVKSRFSTIVELNVDTNDWVIWALNNGMSTELISFIQFRPEMLDNFVASKDIVNSPCPRTVAYVGKMMNAGLSVSDSYFFEIVNGATGEAFAREFTEYLKIYLSLPSINQIILDPVNSPVPSELSGKYAISGAIADKMTAQNVGALVTYLNRLPKELAVMSFKSATVKNPSVCATREFIQFFSQNQDLMI